MKKFARRLLLSASVALGVLILVSQFNYFELVTPRVSIGTTTTGIVAAEESHGPWQFQHGANCVLSMSEYVALPTIRMLPGKRLVIVGWWSVVAVFGAVASVIWPLVREGRKNSFPVEVDGCTRRQAYDGDYSI